MYWRRRCLRVSNEDCAYVVKRIMLAALIGAIFASSSWGASPVSTPSMPATRSASPPSPTASPLKASAPAAAPTPAPLSEQRDVIAFLGDAIAWYRQLNVEAGLVQEPAETLYLAADQEMADEIIKQAFDYSQAEADLLAKFGPAAAPEPAKNPGPTDGLDRRVAEIGTQIDDAQTQVKNLTARLRKASRGQKDTLTRQLVAAQAQLELLHTRSD